MFGKYLVVLLPLLVLSFQKAQAATIASARDKSQILLVVSYDSFNKKYLELDVSPNLKQVQVEGISVPYLRNVFTTKTFPNHFSIATGLYPDRHGVVNNVIFDKRVGGELKYGKDYYHMDETVTPIWTLNEELGGHSACLYYPGSNFQYHNRSCTFTEIYTPKLDFQKRVDLAFGYMQHSETPANLVMLYFEQPDDAGHKYGPNSKQVKEEIAHVDRITKYILDGVKKNNLENRLNVIFMSDHGMETVKLSVHMLDLSKCTDNSTYVMYGSSPVVQIVPNSGQFDSVLKSLREAEKKLGHFKTYTNEELPKRWHYRVDQRVGPITIVAERGYVFNDFYSHVDWFKQQNVTKTDDEYGVHGYDNAEESMRAVFMGKGPAFKSRFEGNPVDNIDLYYLFCKVLKLKAPRKLDGNEKSIEQFLVDTTASGNKIRSDYSKGLLLLGIALIIGLAISIAVIVTIKYMMQSKRSRRKMESQLDSAFNGNVEAETMRLIASDSDEG